MPVLRADRLKKLYGVRLNEEITLVQQHIVVDDGRSPDGHRSQVRPTALAAQRERRRAFGPLVVHVLLHPFDSPSLFGKALRSITKFLAVIAVA
ncbi:unnamed protein product [Angiostrongylus costaricensis]|uniref:ABC transporter ATP-binding protein n=1 Tax=Angiostrongylus costaricensis TaxID=334426 RepID=A0A0R3PCE4_ANGCS|nr:unnamed protein product [Angiostrongylus costaricensis]